MRTAVAEPRFAETRAAFAGKRLRRTRFAPVIVAANELLALVGLWRNRALTRRHLARLDDHMLKDIGLHPAVVEFEVSKPFWRA